MDAEIQAALLSLQEEVRALQTAIKQLRGADERQERRLDNQRGDILYNDRAAAFQRDKLGAELTALAAEVDLLWAAVRALQERAP